MLLSWYSKRYKEVIKKFLDTLIFIANRKYQKPFKVELNSFSRGAGNQ